MAPSDYPNPTPEIPKDDPPPADGDTPNEIDLPPTIMPSNLPPIDRSLSDIYRAARPVAMPPAAVACPGHPFRQTTAAAGTPLGFPRSISP